MRVPSVRMAPVWRAASVGVVMASLVLGGAVAAGAGSSTASASPVSTSVEQQDAARSVAATVQRLADIEDIKQLKARYFRAIDTKQWGQLQATFTPDAAINIGQVFKSPAELVQASKSLIGDAPTAHQGFLPQIAVNGDTATGTWSMEDLVSLQAGGGFHGHGEYHDTYQRVNGRWYISGTQLIRFRLETLPG